MNDRDDLAADPAQERTPIATRAAAPTPRRLSRKALATLAGVSALGVAAALGYSLTASRSSQAPEETVSVGRQKADALADAPKDYSDIVRAASTGIGPPPAAPEPITTPPLPGATPTSPNPRDSEADAERQRRRQQRDSALASKLFAGTSETGRAGTPSVEAPAILPGQASPGQPASTGNTEPQDRKSAFVAGGTREATVNSGRLEPPPGRFAGLAGSTIAAALITGLSSDLPGQVVAQVTEDVFDTVTGQTRLVPQGTRLVGTTMHASAMASRARWSCGRG